MVAAHHPRMKLARPYTIKAHSLRAKIAAWVLREPCLAMVWSNQVLLHGISIESFCVDKKWLRHELKHVEQFQRHGFYTFILLYLWESARKGYLNNKYEQEARQAENDEGIEQRFILRNAH
jgi:hypothetical protein